jgi:small GTP-binding protein
MNRGKRVDFSVKTVIIGDSGVGKTCLLTRYVRDYFEGTSQPTLGVEFLAKVVDTQTRHIELQLWDTAGQELFRCVTRGYYRNAAVAYLVFDLTLRSSFVSLEKWITDVKEVGLPDLILVVLGNKSDCVEKRETAPEEIEAFVKKHGLKYFEVSAKSGENVVQAFTSVMGEIEERAEKGEFRAPVNSDAIISSKPQAGASSCC